MAAIGWALFVEEIVPQTVAPPLAGATESGGSPGRLPRFAMTGQDVRGRRLAGTWLASWAWIPVAHLAAASTAAIVPFRPAVVAHWVASTAIRSLSTAQAASRQGTKLVIW